MKILVTGGGGYIGSHMVKLLGELGHEVTTIDNLSTGHREAILIGDFRQIDLLNFNELNNFFKVCKFDVVIHFAGSIVVGESMQNPLKYYRNNVIASINLLDAMIGNDMDKLVFSSTAAIFGNPQYVPIDECHPQYPINPYGKTKQIFEQILHDYSRAYDLNSVALRYFNASGADPDGLLGERHNPETHLIPLALRAVNPLGKKLTIFGRDYDTPDGTCIRDYIHVLDLCDAHVLAINHLMSGGGSRQYNLGNGSGYSVLEVIDTVKSVTGKCVHLEFGERRVGDPPRLIADARKINMDWGWRPKYVLEDIVQSAWEWECRNDGNKM